MCYYLQVLSKDVYQIEALQKKIIQMRHCVCTYLFMFNKVCSIYCVRLPKETVDTDDLVQKQFFSRRVLISEFVASRTHCTQTPINIRTND